MKADMDKHGCLTVRAETGVEAYALQKWWVECAGNHGVFAIDVDAFEKVCGIGPVQGREE